MVGSWRGGMGLEREDDNKGVGSEKEMGTNYWRGILALLEVIKDHKQASSPCSTN